ncbi:nucleoside-diphosphate kinase [bacterium]|nr:nucleoside-diphosphate kinase [bacterium]
MTAGANKLEQTLVLIKPDALKNSMTGYVLSQLSEFHSGLRFAGAKIVCVSRMLAEAHYAEHREKPFFNALIEYLTGVAHYPDEAWKRRVIALVFQGNEAIRHVRAIAGPTDPNVAREKLPGSIRSMGAIVPVRDGLGKIIGERLDNLIHASATSEEADREIKLWFKPNDIPPSMRIYETRASEEHFYYKDGRLYIKHEPGSVCLLAPGDTAWATDLDALHAVHAGRPSGTHLQAVAAKYLINEDVD